MKTKQKPKRMSELTLNNLFFNNDTNCRDFFFTAFHPNGFICPKCGHTHYCLLSTRHNVYQCNHCYHQSYLFAGTIFQDNKLPLYTLLLGIYHFVHAKNGISAEHLATLLGVNRKSAQLLCRKLRIVMLDESQKTMLESMFIESDVAYIGGVSKNGKRGLGTDKVPFIVALETNKEDNYPQQLKVEQISSETKEAVLAFFKDSVVKNKETLVKTDGKSSYSVLNKWFTVESDIIEYSNDTHALYWTHIIISNIKAFIDGTFHGITKKWLYLFVNEYVWKFNHRYSGIHLMSHIQSALFGIAPHPRRSFSLLTH